MKAVELRSRDGFGGLAAVERDPPRPGPHDVVVRIRAASLNFRDLAIARGTYGNFPLPIVPLSDGAGEVVEVGDAVTRIRVGDRVCPHYVVDWRSGPPSAEVVARRLGGPLDGVLAELACVPEHAVVRTPAHMSDAEASTLPIAGVTAWQALFVQGRVQPGDVVVVQGTGGVSTFALQLARLAGARVIVTSGSPEKLERARALGAWAGIDYRAHPEWQREVERLTDGRGANHVIDVVGGANVARSVAATCIGGTLSLIGFLDAMRAEIDLPELFRRVISVQAISVGSRAAFEGLAAACEAGELRPVVDRVFPFAEHRAAFEHMAAGRHLGKVVIAID
ncbi:MAG: NAD(P)-dependent alcohol dehydrogenase [Ectothiorhodospiraceae bacterium]|nr:NAD(P)-dependent alcohol dehydrogenase [Chromatiales bacterium]MCP5156548.1 NAD(P)-dependent alcohol dehydrogenase [Ectothiorhodospiraceae bacterium]